MQKIMILLIATLSLCGNPLSAKIIATPGSMDTTGIYGRSTMVCRGKVLSVISRSRENVFIDGREVTYSVNAALFRIERIYKGVALGTITVRFGTYSSPMLIQYPLKPDSEVLLFLKSVKNNEFEYADQFYSRFYVSSIIESVPGSTSLSQMEKDLESGLNDESRDRVLVNMELLEGFEKLNFPDSLALLADRGEPEIRGHAYAALLKQQDCARASQLVEFLSNLPVDNNVPLLNISMQLHNLSACNHELSLLIKLSASRHDTIRIEAVRLLRDLADPASVEALVMRLDDTNSFIVFDAIRTLAAITGKTGEEYSPDLSVFRHNEPIYIKNWKDWWEAQGRRVYSNKQSS